ncbi:LytTR family transcriptional regulator [Spirosoma sp. HMF4905]|uniref:LytTR family transcriptional regulator n=1 Tax=Spirosoma arboris TaxID=2682092 RepID=A0A7K1SJS7_9BACT|nr:LytTR family DNA-binding domain-containing protein [Spirosoma arboris]MVM33836.1 LytTR family transcriptional regulator [Spirosoma arboris]
MKRSDAAQVQHKFDPKDILYLTGDANYSTVYLRNGQAILTSRTLKWYCERWPQFLRAHKGNLVNPAHIHSCIVVSSIEAHLVMNNGARLAVGRRRINEVVDQLGIALSKYSGINTHMIKPDWRSFALAQVQLA